MLPRRAEPEDEKLMEAQRVPLTTATPEAQQEQRAEPRVPEGEVAPTGAGKAALAQAVQASATRPQEARLQGAHPRKVER